MGSATHHAVTSPDPGDDPLIAADYSGWWRRSIAIVRAGWRPLMAVQAVGVALHLVTYAPLLAWSVSLTPSLTRTGESGEPVADVTAFVSLLGLIVVGEFLILLVTSAVTVASVYVGVAVAVREPPRVGAALAMAARRMFALLGWQFVAGVLITLGMCACFLPAVYLFAVFTLLPVVVAVERTNVVGRCFRLFHRDLGASVARIGTILGITMGVALVTSVVNSIANAATGVQVSPFGVGATVTDENVGRVVLVGSLVMLFSTVVSAAVAVFTAPMTLTAYADLRSGREELSTPVLAAELGIGSPPVDVRG